MNDYIQALIDLRDKLHELERTYSIKVRQTKYRDEFAHGMAVGFQTSMEILNEMIRNEPR